MEFEIKVEAVETETKIEEIYYELLYQVIEECLSEVINNEQGCDISKSVY